MNRKFKTLKNEYKDNFIDALSYHLKQKQIDEMNEYTKEFGRSQFVEMLVNQKEEIAMLKSQLEESNFKFDYEAENVRFQKDYVKCLKNWLEQKNKVIDETIQLLEYYYIDNLKYDKESQKAFRRMLSILYKSKGDSNE